MLFTFAFSDADDAVDEATEDEAANGEEDDEAPTETAAGAPSSDSTRDGSEAEREEADTGNVGVTLLSGSAPWDDGEATDVAEDGAGDVADAFVAPPGSETDKRSLSRNRPLPPPLLLPETGGDGKAASAPPPRPPEPGGGTWAASDAGVADNEDGDEEEEDGDGEITVRAAGTVRAT